MPDTYFRTAKDKKRQQQQQQQQQKEQQEEAEHGGAVASSSEEEGGEEKPVQEKYFQEAFTSSNRMVRIYKVLRVSKKSKAYCAEGRGYKAWYEGRPLTDAYPPALQKIIAAKEDFQQLEDFNKKRKRSAGADDRDVKAVNYASYSEDDADDDEEEDNQDDDQDDIFEEQYGDEMMGGMDAYYGEEF